MVEKRRDMNAEELHEDNKRQHDGVEEENATAENAETKK